MVFRAIIEVVWGPADGGRWPRHRSLSFGEVKEVVQWRVEGNRQTQHEQVHLAVLFDTLSSKLSYFPLHPPAHCVLMSLLPAP